jgi:hypothetical protein
MLSIIDNRAYLLLTLIRLTILSPGIGLELSQVGYITLSGTDLLAFAMITNNYLRNHNLIGKIETLNNTIVYIP